MTFLSGTGMTFLSGAYILNPKGEAAPSPQTRLVGRPIRYLEQHLRNVVAALGVVFMGHEAIRTGNRSSSYHPRTARMECTNASIRAPTRFVVNLHNEHKTTPDLRDGRSSSQHHSVPATGLGRIKCFIGATQQAIRIVVPNVCHSNADSAGQVLATTVRNP